MNSPPPNPPEPPATVVVEPVRGGIGAAFTVGALGLALAALWSLTAVGREWRAPPAPFVLLISFLPYVYAAYGAAVFAVWAVLPDRRAPPALLAAVVLSGLVLWGPMSLPRRPSDGAPVRAMTWNVRRLWGPEGSLGRPFERRGALDCVVDTVDRQDPDLITFLEVSSVDVADLSSRLDLSCVHSDYMGVDQADLGGLAVCARAGRWDLRSGGGRQFVDQEDWRYVFAEFERDHRVINVFAVHLQPYAFHTHTRRVRLDAGAQGVIDLGHHGETVHRAQVDQARALLDRTARLQDPTLVMGDFNSTRDTALHVSLRRDLIDTWEAAGRGFGATVAFLGHLPLRVDYLYASAALSPVRATVPDARCSDHQPVVADLVFKR